LEVGRVYQERLLAGCLWFILCALDQLLQPRSDRAELKDQEQDAHQGDAEQLRGSSRLHRFAFLQYGEPCSRPAVLDLHTLKPRVF
jgi:hypothetical protein